MDATAISRFARLSPTKARDLARKVQGLPVEQALGLLELSERKAARLIGKTLRSAIANAASRGETPAGSLRVKTAVIEEGPRLRRYWPRARGSVSPIAKRTCHVRIVVADEAREAAGTTA
jgi:large subunit ribosomal protein L22